MSYDLRIGVKVKGALNALKSLYQCILDNRAGERKTWNEIPLELMYMRW